MTRHEARALIAADFPAQGADMTETGTITAVLLRSLSDPRHLLVDVEFSNGRVFQAINTYFADGPVYHWASVPTAKAPETFESIAAWQRETFGVPTIEDALLRAAEKWTELDIANQYDRQDEVIEEAADVVIRLLHMPGVPEAIQAKMAVNRSRTWRMNGDGTGQHEEEG